MKRKWSRPNVLVEEFAANEYVSACSDVMLTGNIQVMCAIPGSHAYTVNDGDGERNWHGPCGNWTTTGSLTGGSGQISERYSNGNLKSPVTISGVQIGDATTLDASDFSENIGTVISTDGVYNGYYKAKWTNIDTTHGTGSYSHYGIALISNATFGKNHS